MTTIDLNLFHGYDEIGLAFATHRRRGASPCFAWCAAPPIGRKISGIDGGYRPHVPAVRTTTAGPPRLLATAAAYKRPDMASFIMDTVLPTARQIVNRAGFLLR